MSFDSLEFMVFLPLVTLLHWLCPGRGRWAVLLAASYVFYAWWDVRLSLLILGVTAVSWLAGRLLARTERPGLRRLWLGVALGALLGLLGYFKYFNFLGRCAAALVGGAWEPWDIVLPVGVSFYTLQAVSYVIDVCRGTLAAEGHFGYYALYISFFPQLVAGPIERAGDLLPQLRGERRLSGEDFRAGCRLLLSGFFRKLAVADLCAPFVEAVWSAPAPDGSAVAAGTVLFALQIYCDFSGYSEIAAGAARLLGVRLMENFDRPYLAGSIREFWRRWHISLTGWLTDYVYIPLGGSRRGLPRQVAATLAVFALSGLWHGADWSFVVWGLLHGGYLAAELLLRRWTGRGTPHRGPGKWAGRAVTLAAVCFAWIFFRSADLGQAAAMVGALFSPWDPGAGAACLGINAGAAVQLALSATVLPVLHREARRDGGGRDMTWVLLMMAVALAWLIRLESGAENAFIYFQF